MPFGSQFARVLGVVLIGFATAASASPRAETRPAPLAPQGTDLSGLWRFTDKYARAGEVVKIFHAGDRIFGIIEKGAYDFIIRGSVQGRAVKFEIAPTDIKGLNPTEPMKPDDMRSILGRAVSKLTLTVGGGGRALTLTGEQATWVYSPTTKTVRYDNKHRRVLTRTDDFQGDPGVDVGGEWRFKKKTVLDIEQKGRLLRGAITLSGKKRFMLGYLEGTDKLRFYEFIAAPGGFRDPVTYARIVERHAYTIAADGNRLEGTRSLTAYGHNEKSGRFAYARTQRGQRIVWKRKGGKYQVRFTDKDFKPVEEAIIYVVYPGGPGTGEVWVEVEAEQGHPDLDDDKIDTIKVRVTSASDETGDVVECVETEKASRIFRSKRAVLLYPVRVRVEP